MFRRTGLGAGQLKGQAGIDKGHQRLWFLLCGLDIGVGFFHGPDLKLFSSHLASSSVAIDQLIGVEIILGNPDALPSLIEVMGIQCIESVILAVVPQYVLWHGADVEVRMIMLKPEIVAQDEHFHQRGVGIKFQFDGLSHRPKPFQQSNTLPHFFSKPRQCVFGVADRFDALGRLMAVGVDQKDFCAEAFIENGGQIANLVDEAAVTTGTDNHDGAAGALLFLDLFNVPLGPSCWSWEKRDEPCAGSCGRKNTVAPAATDIIDGGDQQDGDDHLDHDH